MKSVINSSSSLFILISWSLLLSHCVVVFSTLNTEGEALLSLLNKFSSSSDGNHTRLNWNNLSSSSTTPCDWLGIICNTEKTHVVSLNLSANYSVTYGQLGPQIGQLTYLKYLDLSHNNFDGSIPIELWNCSHLQYLDLSSNRFSGKLPEAVKNLHQLNFLSISDNELSGRIPVSLFQISGLKSVHLDGNSFSGSIPTELWNSSHLQHLDLSGNNFTGEFPHEAMRNLHQLKTFSISWNQFSGRIPEYLFQNSGLEDVDLRDNNLSGSIPTSIANCTKLVVLGLSNNGGLSGELPVEMTELRQLKWISLSDNHFFGSIPKDLGINSSLEYVDFSNNTFSGEIPPNLCFGQKLTYMMFDHNQFHGNIPSSYTQNCDSLTKLNLQGNKLTGSLPHFGQINNPSDTQGMLLSLDLSRNNIHGQIPSSICSLIHLLELDLSENHMNGTLPHCLGDINQLFSLNLRSNNFSGTIPMNFTSDGLSWLDLNGNCLEGKIPRTLGINSPKLQYLDLGNNQFNDTFPSFLEILPNLMFLLLRSNKLYGPLKHPHSRYLPFSMLRILDISNNYFSGNLPLEFILGLDAMKNIDEYDVSPDINYFPYTTVVIHKGKEMRLNNTMMNSFRTIDTSNNRFQGSIPESIGELLLLTSLNLSNNNLNGRIPSSLGNLTRLESLDLSNNKLFGEIPGQLTNLNFLGVLNLSHNHLTGHIPTAGQFQTFPNDSFDGNPGLCGLQSSTGCRDANEGCSLYQDPVEDSNSWNFGWEPVVIGYGCGVLIGLVLQYFIFTKAFLYRWFG